jgi:hypothetical protein
VVGLYGVPNMVFSAEYEGTAAPKDGEAKRCVLEARRKFGSPRILLTVPMPLATNYSSSPGTSTGSVCERRPLLISLIWLRFGATLLAGSVNSEFISVDQLKLTAREGHVLSNPRCRGANLAIR